MTVGVETCSPDTPVSEVARALLENGGENIVVMEGGHALGVIGVRELLQVYALEEFAALTAREVFQEGVPQVPPDIPLKAAAQIMLDQGTNVLYLMHHAGGIEYPAGYISYRHILRHIAAKDEEELRDLGIYAERHSPLEVFIRKRDQAQRKNRPTKE